ncbi:MAG: hypothetical protein ACRD44_10070 [Bryobacteraceae bacterium]
MRITVREGIYGERRPLGPEEFRIENREEVALSRPAAPGSIYEVVYYSADPAIAGLGLAGLRDTVAFFRHGGPATALADRRGF